MPDREVRRREERIDRLGTGQVWSGAKTVCLLAVMAALTVLAIPLPHPLSSGRLSGVLDLGHFVLFGSLTFCLFWPLKPRAWSACGLAVALAVLSEAGQSLVGRTASVQDALLGMLGALIALIVLLACRITPARKKTTRIVGRIADPYGMDCQSVCRGTDCQSVLRNRHGVEDLPCRGHTRWSSARMMGAMAAVLVLAAWPVARAIPYALDAWSEYWEFPVLCDFQSPWQVRRWLAPGAVIRRVPGGLDGETSVGEVDFPGTQNRTGTIVLKPLIGEWSGYRRLCCEFSFDGDPIKVSAFLQTGEGKSTAQARCLDRVFAPGNHRVSIDLAPGQKGGTGQLDLSRVRSLCFSFAGLKGPRIVLLHRVFLASPGKAGAGALANCISASARK